MSVLCWAAEAARLTREAPCGRFFDVGAIPVPREEGGAEMPFMFSEGLGLVVERDETSGLLIAFKPGDNSKSFDLSRDEAVKFFSSPKRFLSEEEAKALNLSLAERDPENTSPPSK